MSGVDLVVMNGRTGETEAELMVDDGREAITADLIARAIESGAFASIIVATNSAALGQRLTGLPLVIVEMDPPEEPFHFGQRLQQLIAKHDLERVVYMGGGSAPLVSKDVLCDMADQVARAERLILANNFYSVDFCAFTPASSLLSIDLPATDNALGWALARVGLTAKELRRTAETMFDVDTPVDLMTLSLHPKAPEQTRRFLDSLHLDTDRLETASRVFVDRQGEAFVAGRISSTTMSYLERETLCRRRVVSEERGMRSDGRLARGEVRSLLGMHLEAVGMHAFFQEVLPRLGKAAFIDDRVIWAHCGVWPEAADRFNSDLLRPDAVADPFLRRFTSEALACPIPIVLGGHSLLAGGLYALVDVAWSRSGVDVQRMLERL